VAAAGLSGRDISGFKVEPGGQSCSRVRCSRSTMAVADSRRIGRTGIELVVAARGACSAVGSRRSWPRLRRSSGHSPVCDRSRARSRLRRSQSWSRRISPSTTPSQRRSRSSGGSWPSRLDPSGIFRSASSDRPRSPHGG